MNIVSPKESKNTPKISVVMIDGSFRESFHLVDFFGNQTFPKDEYELLWVEYYDKVNPYLAAKISKYPNFQIITLRREGVYHSSYCFNAGILASKGELLVIPDADQVVESNFLEIVYKVHQTNDKLAVYIYRYDEPKEKHIQEVTIEHLRKVCLLKNPQNYGGCLTVRKKWLLKINGYEQHSIFGTGDHANGRDVYTRLKNLGLQIMWHPELRLYHLWHPETLRAAPMHKIQQVFVDYRSLAFATLPFQGIDSTKDSEPPKHLKEKLEEAIKSYSYKSMEPQKPRHRIRKFARRIPVLTSLARFIRKIKNRILALFFVMTNPRVNSTMRFSSTKRNLRKLFRNEILLLKNKHRSYNNNYSILYFGVYRSGTSIVGRILSLLAQSQGMTPVDFAAYFRAAGKYIGDDKDRKEVFKSWSGEKKVYKKRGYFYGPFRTFEQVGKSLPLDEYRIILQLRDPRDVLVSLYFSRAYSQIPRPNREPEYYKQFFDSRKKIQKMTIDEFVLKNTQTVYSEWYLPYCQHLLNKPNVLFLKYEELVTDFTGWLDKVIRFLGFDVDQKTKEQIIKRANTLLTVKKENIYAHQRQMKPGDHKRKLKKETINKLNKTLAEILNLLQYSK